MLNKEKINHNDFTLNHTCNHINKDKRIIKLTDTENKILTLLLKNPDTIFSKDEILNYAWDKDDNNYTSVVPQAISILRKKLYRHNIDAIDTVKGRGYRASSKNSSNKKHINNIYLYIIPFCLIGASVTSYIIINNKDISPAIDQHLIKSNDNIYQPSNSESVILNKNNLHEKIKYFINKQEKSISISACEMLGNECSSIYNKIYFIDNSETSINIDELINEISFEFEKPLKNLSNKEANEFKMTSSINLSAINNLTYKGHAYINYDIQKKDNHKYNATLSAYVKETGYIGSYGYNVNITAITKKKKDQFIALIERNDRDVGSGRQHFGTIRDQNQLYAYPKLLNTERKAYYTHIYPMGKGVHYVYMEEMNLSYLAFSYK
ncbi:winged helix-turn-helix domain-containing protein [Aliivibrio sp. EL58]|uniref:winged helix-turn-helix domain-containing protein n=1 Tax=Aliivibrio sp. EL58 TaxID=2107582 RepID=UPI000EFB94CA|nr:winged helix-turn-helix domain-containing protein [Aliivibrio sp. EL58]